MFFGLIFLARGEVDECFVEDPITIQPQDDSVELFTDYTLETYNSEESIFPLTILAKFYASMNRTTNCYQAFYSKRNKLFFTFYSILFILTHVFWIFSLKYI